MGTARLIRDFLLARGQTHRYGPHRSQCAELHLPAGTGPHPVMILIHGGSWQKRYSKLVMRALARDLRRRGWAVWNIEYRRIGAGGGWPETFIDVGAAVDHVRALRAPLDQDRVSVLGHSAGGQLALWAAGRAALPPHAPGAPASGSSPTGFARAIALRVSAIWRAPTRNGGAAPSSGYSGDPRSKCPSAMRWQTRWRRFRSRCRRCWSTACTIRRCRCG